MNVTACIFCTCSVEVAWWITKVTNVSLSPHVNRWNLSYFCALIRSTLLLSALQVVDRMEDTCRSSGTCLKSTDTGCLSATETVS